MTEGKISKTQRHIDGTIVAEMIMAFHREFGDVYPYELLVSEMMAVGPMQSFIGLAIEKGLLQSTLNPASSATEGVEPVALLRKARDYIDDLPRLFPENAHPNDRDEQRRLEAARDPLLAEIDAALASPPNAEPAPVVTDAMVEAAIDAKVMGTVPVLEFMDFTAADARDLGVKIDGENFAALDVIRYEQWRDTGRAIMRIAISAALSLPVEGAAKEGVRS